MALGVGWAGPVAADSRSAKVAGQFYPAAPEELRQTVQQLLSRDASATLPEKPRILIVPHAGYPYSGPVAAQGYRQLRGRTYDGVVVIGFTHRIQFRGVSVDTRERYDTPLGEIPVDQEAVAILQTFPGITHVEEAHETNEHSLEVQLPFLQMTLERFKLVPVLMGGVDLADAARLADALTVLAKRGNYLFVFSTDLSHYHPYEEATALDRRTVGAILFETPQAVDRLFAHGVLEACGRGPIVASLLLATKLGYLKPTLITYANSGDTTGERTRVVGYAAIAMDDRPPVATDRLSPAAGSALVAAARRTLQRHIGNDHSQSEVALSQYPELANTHGLFVTLRKRGELRGCIGRIETVEPMASALPAVALDAALHDPRFPPVTAEELPALHVEVSVLTPPVALSAPAELVPGRDGVILDFRGHRGVFLPQVWEETGWTRVEFLRELASQKAGVSPDAWQQATLFVFQDQAFEEPVDLTTNP